MTNESLPLFVQNDSTKAATRKEPVAIQPLHEGRNGGNRSSQLSVDQAANDVIRSNFDAKIIGSWLVRFADETDGVDRAIAFSAIVSKARNARKRKAGM